MKPKVALKSALLSTIALGGASFGAAPLFAQTVPPDAKASAPVQAETDQTGLADIIVTATKRSENVQRVPIAVTVVSSEAIQTQNLAQTSDLARVAPTVTFTAASLSIANIFSIRGIGTFATNSGLEPSVGIVVDGVPLVRAVGSIGDLTDLDHVEVLNGPQGTLFGKNASAGVISLTTVAPKMGVSEFIGHASYASYNNVQLSGTANVPLSDTVAARVAIFHDEHDGVTHDVKTGKDYGDLNTSGVRAKVRFQPSSDLDLTVTGEYSRHRENGYAVSIVGLNTGIPGYANTVAPAIAAYEASQGIVIGPENNKTSTTRPDLQSNGTTRGVSAQLNYTLGTHTITGLVSWRRVKSFDAFEGSGAGGPAFYPDNLSDDYNDIKQTTAELRIASPTSNRLRYVFGVFFQSMNLNELFRLDAQTSIGAPGGPQVLNASSYFSFASDIGIKTKNYAAFGEGTYDLTDRLRLTVGGRIAHDDVSGSLDRSILRGPSGALPPFLTAPGAAFGPISLNTSTKYTNLSGRGSVQYQVTESAMGYVTVSRGYKGPGVDYSYTSSTGGTVGREIATSYEAGIKSTLLDHRLRLNLAVFNTILDGFQVSIPTPEFGPSAFAVRNAKELKSTGGSVDLTAQVAKGWTIAGAAAYTHARFTDFANAGCYPGQTAAQGCVGGFQSLDGETLPNAPKWSLQGSSRYETNVSDTLTAFGQVAANWQSRVIFGTNRDVNTVQPAYAIVSISAGLKSADGKYGISVFANNLLDQHYVGRIGPSGGGSYYVSNQIIGAYRSVGVALDTRF